MNDEPYEDNAIPVDCAPPMEEKGNTALEEDAGDPFQYGSSPCRHARTRELFCVMFCMDCACVWWPGDVVQQLCQEVHRLEAQVKVNTLHAEAFQQGIAENELLKRDKHRLVAELHARQAAYGKGAEARATLEEENERLNTEKADLENQLGVWRGNSEILQAELEAVQNA
jgi:hypothetical protein